MNREHPNRLIHAQSAYLLQHAYNPVEWYSWGDEALEKAKQEDKPIFLSIGYSACHWCHVMAHECFENPDIARLMNENFVNIKVDREERPDLDEIYMNAVQMMTGSGGWPMSVFLTPDLKPYFGGTYFPPYDMYGRPGFPSILMGTAQAYRERRAEVEESAETIAQDLQSSNLMQTDPDKFNEQPLETAFHELELRFDSRYGGFGNAPKFPHSLEISFLLRYYRRTHNPEALHMAEFSLQQMARGGMYDQIGGGFHRYSTDERWLIPHFEKMLYDNALLVKTYLEAYQLTRSSGYRKIAAETLDYVLREMTSPIGGFYSTQDADSDGREGAFYVWTPQEMEEVLGGEKAKVICRYYGVDAVGNFEEDTSALQVAIEEETIAKLFDLSKEQLIRMIKEANGKLFARREKRIKPERDEKVLTDWNGLMISALALGGNVLQVDKYHRAAETACDFLCKNLLVNERLLHVYQNQQAYTLGFLSDYAFMIQGLLDTYEAVQNPIWLEKAIQLCEAAIPLFWDDQEKAFYFTGSDHESLIARTKNPMDNAVPSGNSIMVLNLLRLAEITGNRAYRQRAEACLRAFFASLGKMPAAFAQMLSALDFYFSLPQAIVLAGSDPIQLKSYQDLIFSHFLPHKVVLYSHYASLPALVPLSSIVKDKLPINGKPTAYICENFSCRPPVTTLMELKKMLK